jgi:single-stranded-DNA-specific exonuclease
MIRRRECASQPEFGAHLHPVLQRIYAARGVNSDHDLDLSLDQLLPVGSLAGVDAAADLLAAHRNGRVLVIGDFDADGATSSALVVRGLRSLGFAHVDFLVPNRFRFGYGLTPEIVAMAATRHPSLLVTVDNGVSSVEGVEAARSCEIPVLITDHHLPGAELPRAAAMVNPNLRDAEFASPALAGVGVAFYVIAALCRRFPASDFRPADLLDLVALGTVADVVPLDHNNRILVSQGLRRVRAGRCVAGIRTLLQSGGRSLEQVVASDLGFAVAPRLNAAGRLTDMSVGISCLLADDIVEATRLAAMLSKLNDERREIEKRMQGDAIDLVETAQLVGSEKPMGLCLFDQSWHQGVVGLVAGRIKDRLNRPVIAFARAEDGSLRGSARSIAGVNIRDTLDSIAVRNPRLIQKFGGHAMAAGLTLSEAHLDEFRAEFCAEVARRADKASLAGVILSDGELATQYLSIDMARRIRDAGPWGQGFPEPIFDGEFAILEARVVGDRHLKLRMRAAAGGEALDAIAFGYVGGACENPLISPGAVIQIAYRLEINQYKGVERAQLNCQHLQPLSGAGAGGGVREFLC